MGRETGRKAEMSDTNVWSGKYGSTTAMRSGALSAWTSPPANRSTPMQSRTTIGPVGTVRCAGAAWQGLGISEDAVFTSTAVPAD